MRHTWSGLGLLLVVPWLAGCVSGPQVRLDTGQGAPIVYSPRPTSPRRWKCARRNSSRP
jgi:hypothetical protein